MVELVEPLQEQPLDDYAGDADQYGRDDERRPIAEPGILQQEIGGEGAHHVLGAVAEIDDVEHAENHGQPEAQQRIERAIDQPDQELSEQRCRRDAENFEHANAPSGQKGRATARPLVVVKYQPLTSGQPPSLSGGEASAAGVVAFTL